MREKQLREIVSEEIAKINVNTVPAMMTAEELGELLGVKESTLKLWRHKGIGPAYIKPGGVRYLVADVNAYILSTRAKTDN